MNQYTERLYNGIIKENPTFVLMLGMCPTLAVTTSAINGLGMGLSTTVVLVLSNLMISLLRKIIPDSLRIPAFIVVVASFVTMVQFLMEGFVPSLYDSLGIYIPLIVVNCIILGRAESYASKNPPLPSIFAASKSSVGTFSLNCFIKKIPKGQPHKGRIMAQEVSWIPIKETSFIRGTRITCFGRAIANTKMLNNSLSP